MSRNPNTNYFLSKRQYKGTGEERIPYMRKELSPHHDQEEIKEIKDIQNESYHHQNTQIRFGIQQKIELIHDENDISSDDEDDIETLALGRPPERKQQNNFFLINKEMKTSHGPSSQQNGFLSHHQGVHDQIDHQRAMSSSPIVVSSSLEQPKKIVGRENQGKQVSSLEKPGFTLPHGQVSPRSGPYRSMMTNFERRRRETTEARPTFIEQPIQEKPVFLSKSPNIIQITTKMEIKQQSGSYTPGMFITKPEKEKSQAQSPSQFRSLFGRKEKKEKEKDQKEKKEKKEKIKEGKKGGNSQQPNELQTESNPQSKKMVNGIVLSEKAKQQIVLMSKQQKEKRKTLTGLSLDRKRKYMTWKSTEGSNVSTIPRLTFNPYVQTQRIQKEQKEGIDEFLLEFESLQPLKYSGIEVKLISREPAFFVMKK